MQDESTPNEQHVPDSGMNDGSALTAALARAVREAAHEAGQSPDELLRALDAMVRAAEGGIDPETAALLATLLRRAHLDEARD